MITTDKDGTIHFNAENIAENEDGKSNSVSVDDSKEAKETPKEEAKSEPETVTKEAVVKMAQTGHSNSWFDKLVNLFVK